MSESGQFALLRQRRFGPYFATQFLGAFNDNVFRNALIILIAFQSADMSQRDIESLTNFAPGLLILPFFLFSATAGQLADKYEKSMLARRVKAAEIVIMLIAALGFVTSNIALLLATLFLMGAQSSLFGPVKYSILPQHLRVSELTGGNGLVEMGTFLAILLGNIVGERLMGVEQFGSILVTIMLLLVACLGYFASRHIPAAPAAAPDLKINWNLFSETLRGMRFARGNVAVFNSILGISWFWFLGAIYLAQMPSLTRFYLLSDATVYTLLLASFSIGIGVGSLSCERLSGKRIEIGLVPLGAIGLTIFGLDFALNLPAAGQRTTLLTLTEYLAQPAAWRTLFDVVMLGFFGGTYIVPLYALIQTRSEPTNRARVIASNNILNACFMVASAILAIVLLRAGLSIPQLLLVAAIMNAVVAWYIFRQVPEFLLRFLVWLLIHTVYRVTPRGLENIPQEGPALLVCNHVSYVDALILAGNIRRPVRFVMYYRIFRMPILNFLFRTANAIPIAGQKEDPQLLENAYQQIESALRNGELVCIFPEGKLTADGDMNPFRPGVERVLAETPVPVIPMSLGGLWGSVFSRFGGRVLSRWPRKLRYPVELTVGSAIAAQASAEGLFETVHAMRGDNR